MLEVEGFKFVQDSSFENVLNWSIDEVIRWTITELKGCYEGIDGKRMESEYNNVFNGESIDLEKSAGILTENTTFSICDLEETIRCNFHEHNISGDVLFYLSLEDCKKLFDGNLKLSIKFKVMLNRLNNLRNDDKKMGFEAQLVSLLNDLHDKICHMFQEYESQYCKLHLDILEVMKRSLSSFTAPQPSHSQQDYFERSTQKHNSPKYTLPVKSRNHPISPTGQRNISFSPIPNPSTAGAGTPSRAANSGNSSNHMPLVSSTIEPLKQLRASREDSTEKILKNAIKKHNLNEADWRQYVLVICYGDQERILKMNEQPVLIFKTLKQEGLHPAIMLRQKGEFEEVGYQTPGGRF